MPRNYKSRNIRAMELMRNSRSVVGYCGASVTSGAALKRLLKVSVLDENGTEEIEERVGRGVAEYFGVNVTINRW